ncbi:MotA/TolQ/ExbB proton channel family protein [Dyadobacter sp. MSC1_007]|jgi:biopolymer transport protein ExbB/TolQ|uniref:MotA/TolQ/ExbB proton channel family protein n=1 Tax=Dyadobacter sp. MSC1_007 TaxID=2909264 RepID=UPI00202F590C|nr:MotA/TolQ/ExbB proton channel family protein [Dyadobacter sp. MSC1_007]
MLNYLESFLYLISTALAYPVVIGLAGMILWTVVSLGAFVRELYERRKNIHNATDLFKMRYAQQIQDALDDADYADLWLTRLIRNWEKTQINKLDRVRFMIKTGPSLGLIGTLIPMGISLASLSEGNLMAMSANMVTAFTSTIVGIACGVAAYLISMQKEKWLKSDFLECEVYLEVLLRDLEKQKMSLTV